MIVCRYKIAYFYTSLDELADEVAYTLNALGVFYLFNSYEAVLIGFARGLGKFGLVTFSILITYYFVAIPLELLFAFYFDLGLIGLWIGLMCGLFLYSCYLQYLLSFKFDWYQIAREVKERNDREEKLLNEMKN